MPKLSHQYLVNDIPPLPLKAQCMHCSCEVSDGHESSKYFKGLFHEIFCPRFTGITMFSQQFCRVLIEILKETKRCIKCRVSHHVKFNTISAIESDITACLV